MKGMAQSRTTLTVFAPAAGCSAWIAIQIGHTVLPEELARHKTAILDVLRQGGTLRITQDLARDGMVLGRDLQAWQGIFGALDMRCTWKATSELDAGGVELAAGTPFSHRILDDRPVLTVLELANLQEAGKSLQNIITEHSFQAPTYSLGPGDLDVEV